MSTYVKKNLKGFLMRGCLIVKQRYKKLAWIKTASTDIQNNFDSQNQPVTLKSKGMKIKQQRRQFVAM